MTFLGDAVTDLLYTETTDPATTKPAGLIIASFLSGSIQAFSAAKGKLLWTATGLPETSGSGSWTLLKAPRAVDTIAAVTPAGLRATVSTKTGAAAAEQTENLALGCTTLSHMNDDVTALCFTSEKVKLMLVTADAAAVAVEVPADAACDSGDVTINGNVVGRCGAYYTIDAAEAALIPIAQVSSNGNVVAAPSGGYLAVVGDDGAEIVGSKTRALCANISLKKNGRPLALYPGGAAGTVILAMEDRSLHAIAAPTGALLWTREESLAAVVAAEFVALASPDAADVADLRDEYGSDVGGSILERVANRVRGEARRILAKGRTLYASARQTFETLAECRSLDDALAVLKATFALGDTAADSFGFDQLIVAATAPGTVLALRTSNTAERRIQWRMYLGSNSNEKPKITRLHVVRDSPSAEYPILALVRVYEKRTEVVHFNAHSGAILKRAEYPFAAVQSGVLPREEAVVLLERDADFAEMTSVRLTAHLSSPHSTPSEVLNTTAARTHFFLADRERGVLSGFNPEHGAINATASFEAVATWEHAVDADERILAVATHHAKEVVHSGASIQGNLTIRAKYLNPNLAAIASSSPTRGITIRVIDAATGAFLAHVVHPHAAGPVHMAIVEHSVIYHFWGSGQFRIGVIDLYEAETDWHKEAGKVATGPLYRGVQSYQQTYNFPHPVRDIQLIPTAHGSASKFLLIALESGQVYAMDRRMVDTRRPVGATWESDKKLLTNLRDLGVLPYHPRIPLYDRNVVSYSKVLGGLRKVVTAPTALESTSLAVALGEDVFFTRVAPLGSFDILSSDFNCGFLVLTVIVLALVTMALKKLTKSKTLSKYWK